MLQMRLAGLNESFQHVGDKSSQRVMKRTVDKDSRLINEFDKVESLRFGVEVK